MNDGNQKAFRRHQPNVVSIELQFGYMLIAIGYKQ